LYLGVTEVASGGVVPKRSGIVFIYP
jgi:hypothetical protein